MHFLFLTRSPSGPGAYAEGVYPHAHIAVQFRQILLGDKSGKQAACNLAHEWGRGVGRVMVRYAR